MAPNRRRVGPPSLDSPATSPSHSNDTEMTDAPSSAVGTTGHDADVEMADLPNSLLRSSTDAAGPDGYLQQDNTRLDSKKNQKDAGEPVVHNASNQPTSTRVSVDLLSVYRAQIRKALDLSSATIPIIIKGENGKKDKKEFRSIPIKRLRDCITGGPVAFKVATLCSGTEAPLLADNVIREQLRVLKQHDTVEFHHSFSCEIVPFKQAYIRRNTDAPIIFRDVYEVGNLNSNQAMTADGYMTDIPLDTDVLFFGSSCVDFSSLNNVPKHQDVDLTTALEDAFGDKMVSGLIEGQPGPVNPKFHEILKTYMPATNGMISESWSTLLGSLGYVLKAKPMIVIIENVVHFPWKKMVNFFFPMCGYVARHIKLDSNDYGIPQTRQRGWLIAVSYAKFGENAKDVVDVWEGCMRALEHGESVSIEQFLLPPEDPRTIQSRAAFHDRIATTGASKANWARSRTRHEFMRSAKGITEIISLNQLEQSGSVIDHIVPHQRSHQPWIRSLPVRVVDLIDFLYTLGLKEGCDITFKTLVIDLSQNADRMPKLRIHASDIGGIGCITPEGIPWLTDQQRIIFGIEALHLQGIPIDDLQLSSETSEQLRDLAGNAMTATVASAAILSMITAVHNYPPTGLAGPSANRGMVVYRHPQALPRGPLTLEYHNEPDNNTRKAIRWSPAAYSGDKAFTAVTSLWRVGRRYCFCRDAVVSPLDEDKILKCKTCGETACLVCKGNPKHDFAKCPVEHLSSLEHTKRELARYFPATMIFQFFPDKLSVATRFSSASDQEKYGLNVLELLLKLSGSVLFLADIKVTEDLSVHYHSDEMTVQAVVSGEMVSWYIFLNQKSHHLPASGDAFDPSQPIARLQFLSGERIIPEPFDTWQIWKARRISFTMTASRLDDERVSLGFVPNAGTQIPKDIHYMEQQNVFREGLGSVVGEYQKLPNCQTPEHSLFVHKNAGFFLFKDCRPLRAVDKDGFVIARTNRQLENHEFREVIMRFDPEFQLHKELPDSLIGYIDGFWADTKGALGLAAYPSGGSCITYNPEVNLQNHLAGEEDREMQSGQPSQNLSRPQSNSAEYDFAIVAFDAMLKKPMDETTVKLLSGCDELEDGWFRPRRGHIRTFAKNVNFLVHKLPREEFPNFVQDEELPLPLLSDDYARLSYPLIPKVRYVGIQDTPKAREEIFPHINQEKARAYTEQMKQLPQSLAVMFKIRPVDPADAKTLQRYMQHQHLDARYKHVTLEVRITANPRLLFRAALQNLAEHVQFERSGDYIREHVLGYFRVDAAYLAPVAKFDNFNKHIQPTQTMEGDLNMQGLDTNFCPKEYPEDIRKLPNLLKSLSFNKVRLDDDQAHALLKMLYRETHAARFEERDFAESVSPELGVSVMAIAAFGNKLDMFCSTGGVVAHDVGYGKTILSLGICDAQWEHDRKASIEQRQSRDIAERSWREQDNEDEGRKHTIIVGDTLIHLKATLVIVPPTIIEQWKREIEEKLQPNKSQQGAKSQRRWNIICIKTIADMKKTHVHRMREADIVLVSDKLFNDKYIDFLANFSGNDRFKKYTPRTYQDWLQHACSSMRRII